MMYACPIKVHFVILFTGQVLVADWKPLRLLIWKPMFVSNQGVIEQSIQEKERRKEFVISFAYRFNHT